MPELEALGHTALVVGLPIEDPTADLDAYVDAVAAAFGGRGPLVLVGHSVGAPTVLETELRGRLALLGVVLLCPAIPYPPELVHMVTEAAVAHFYQDCASDVAATAVASLRGHAPAGMVGPTALRRIRVPSVLIRATDDLAVDADWSEWSARALTGRPAVVLPGGHSPFLSRPAELARTIVAAARAWAVPESHLDLTHATTASLSTVSPDGVPQVTAIAFHYDEDSGRFQISLNDVRQKARNLRRNPVATLFIVDPENRFRTLEVRADVELEPDTDFSFAALAGARYGHDFHDLDGPGETRSKVTFHPRRIVATDLSN